MIIDDIIICELFYKWPTHNLCDCTFQKKTSKDALYIITKRQSQKAFQFKSVQNNKNIKGARRTCLNIKSFKVLVIDLVIFFLLQIKSTSVLNTHI